MITPPEFLTVAPQDGANLYQLLVRQGISLPSECHGAGHCGLCRVRVKGPVTPLTAIERRWLLEESLGQGIRLACQTYPLDTVRVHRLRRTEMLWRPLSLPPPCLPASVPNQQGLGLAIDLGTTQIRWSLWDFARQQRIAAAIGLNPQRAYGDDVLTRLDLARQSAEVARLLREWVRDAIAEGLRRVLPETARLSRVVIAGNSAMLSLLSGQGFEALLDPNNWTRHIPIAPLPDVATWRDAWRLHETATLELLPPLAGFIGSDLLAGIYASGLLHGPSASMLIDFGTNSEIVLWHEGRLWAASAAGGPAFEGNLLDCGMPAATGAIEHVTIDAAGHATWRVIGDEPPRGLCGAAYIDVLAGLLACRWLRPNGRLLENLAGRYHVTDDIFLSQRDIDVLQRAKAAVATTWQQVLSYAGLPCTALQRLCIAGAFGQRLDARAAQAIGLLPSFAAERVELLGDTALLGAEALLHQLDLAAWSNALRERAVVLNLPDDAVFEENFVAHLLLRPFVTPSA